MPRAWPSFIFASAAGPYVRVSIFACSGLALIATCAQAAGPGPQPAPIDATLPQTIAITIALPLSGPRAGVGLAVKSQIDAAIAAFATLDGTTRPALQIDIVDDGCARDKAHALAADVVAARPAVVIGHPCASAAITAAPQYQAAGVLFMAAGVRHPDLTDKRAGNLVFRAAGRDDRQGADTGQRLRALAGVNGATVILHDRTVMARAIAEAAAQAAARNMDGTAAPPPHILTLVAGEADYSRVVDEIAVHKPSALLFAGFPAEAAIVLRQLRQRGLDMPMLANDAMATSEFADHADLLLESAVEVMMPVSIGREALGAADSAETVIGKDVVAALALWRDAVMATGSHEPSRIAARLAAQRDHIEEIGFDSRGDARAASYAPFHWREGAWRRADLDASHPR